jgi:hypothetical protein
MSLINRYKIFIFDVLLYDTTQRICMCVYIYTSYVWSLSIQAGDRASRTVLSSRRYIETLVNMKVVYLTAVKIKLHVFSNIAILQDFSVLSSQFCYIITCVRKSESRIQIGNRCASWQISNSTVKLFSAGADISLNNYLLQIRRWGKHNSWWN